MQIGNGKPVAARLRIEEGTKENETEEESRNDGLYRLLLSLGWRWMGMNEDRSRLMAGCHIRTPRAYRVPGMTTSVSGLSAASGPGAWHETRFPVVISGSFVLSIDS